MRPVLFTVGDFTVYSYGFMLGMAFVVGVVLLHRELARKGRDPGLVVPVLALALVFGLAGARLFSALEGSPRGLSYLGGFLLATGSICVYLRWKKVPMLRFCDAAAPGLMLAYGVARIGCQLAGDGDYGTPTDLPWGMAYPYGVVPTDERVHPAPVYETLASVTLFAVLWHRRRLPAPDGRLFSLYLVLSGGERFVIEFLRLNPRIWLGLTQAQMISLGLVAAGAAGLLSLLNPPPGKGAAARLENRRR